METDIHNNTGDEFLLENKDKHDKEIINVYDDKGKLYGFMFRGSGFIHPIKELLYAQSQNI
jgi:hypothetical protein